MTDPAHNAEPRILPEGADPLADQAVAPIAPGMVVGLGTGRAANRGIVALARRVRDEKLDIECVCSSAATRELAQSLGLNVVSFDEMESIDYSFDGADEVDRELRMLKGHHGAITRQRLLAAVSKSNVYLAQEDKVVDQLGTRALLAVTIIPFGYASTRNRLRDLGLSGVIRKTMEGEVLMTEGGGVVFDMTLPENCDVEQLALALDHVPGVVDHGLFLTEADVVLVECRKGEVRRLVAQPADR